MSSELDRCPTRDELMSFDAGLLCPEDHEAVERHIAVCAACCRFLEELPEDSLAQRLRNYAGAATRKPDETILYPPKAMDQFGAVPAEFIGHPRYEILGYLGSGAMGTVYRAVQRRMDRVVALKVIHQRLTKRPRFSEQFQQEVKALARLSHANVVSAFDADVAGDSHFVVMEFVEGQGLDEVVRQSGPLPALEACKLIRQAALGLQHAHENGMVHRDIKPQNLMLTNAGLVKVVDFGLALLLAPHEPAPPGSAPEIVGTPDYMSPEQARDPRHANASSDLYSLGCTLWHLLTGVPPFPRPTPLQVLLAHQHDAPRSIRDIRTDVPEAVAHALAKLMAKEPAERYATAAEVVAALTQIVESPPRSPARPRRIFWFWLIGVPVFLLLANFVAQHYSHPREGEPVRNATVDEEAQQNREPELAPMPREADMIALQKREAVSQLLKWINDNNKFGPGSPIVTQTAQDIEKNFAKSDGFELTVGRNTLRSGKPAIAVAKLGGGFRVFDEITENQWQGSPVRDSSRFLRPLRHSNDVRPLPAGVELSNLTIASPDSIDREQPVTGTVTCRFPAPTVPKNCLRLSLYYSTEKQTVGWLGVLYFPPEILTAGTHTLKFSMPPFSSKLLLRERLSVVYMEWVSKSEGPTVVESNAAMALIKFKD